MDGSTCRLATPASVTISVRGAPGMPTRFASVSRRAHQHPAHPSHSPQGVHDVPHRHAGRNREAVPEVPLAAADDRHVDGQEERAVSRRPGPLDEARVRSRFCHTYSWNQSGPGAPAATSSIEQLEWVLSV